MKGLYAIVDPEHCKGRDPLWMTQEILRGGCAALQLRTKVLTDRDALTLARAMRTLCREANVPFWLNDRLDVALLCEADGLHLGQDDLPISEVRKLWGTRPIGLSTHNLAQVERAQVEGADVIGFGPVFTTGSKLNPDPVVGLEGLREASRLARCPVIAIGGVTLESAASVVAAGTRVAAVISAVTGAHEPASVARALHGSLRGD